MRLSNHHSFGQPASLRFFLEEDNGGGNGGGETKPEPVVANPQNDTPTPTRYDDAVKVENQVKPDFSLLGKKPAAESPAKAPEPKEVAKAPEKPEKPADGAPAKPAEAKKPEAKVEKQEEEMAPGKKAIPETDDDLDAAQPRPGSGMRVQNDFDSLRKAAKDARAEARRINAEAASAKAELEKIKQGGNLPEEVAKKLQSAEQIEAEYKKLRRLLEQENDPDFQREHSEQITKAEGTLIAYLKTSGLSDEVLAEIKADGVEGWDRWAELKDIVLKQPNGDLAWQEVLDLRKGRQNALRGREEAIKKIKEDAAGWEQQQQQRTQQGFQKWADDARVTALKVADEFPDLLLEKEVTATMSAEEKQAAEAHNAKVGKIATDVQQRILKSYQKDPQMIATNAMKAAIFDSVKADLDTQLAERTSEVAKLQARVKDLEARIASGRRAGSVARDDGAASAAVTPVSDGLDTRTGAEALNGFLSAKRG